MTTKSISARVTISERESFDALLKDAGLKQNDLLKQLIQLYTVGGVAAIGLTGEKMPPVNAGMTPEQHGVITKGVELSGGDFDSFMIDASVEKAEKLLKLSVTSPEDLKNTPNGAVIRIHNFVLETMEANKAAKDDYHKIGITQGLICKETGANRPAVKKYLLENVNLILKHHEMVNIPTDKSELHAFNVRAKTELARVARNLEKADA